MGKDVLWCGVIDCLIIYVEKNTNGSFPHTKNKNKPNVHQLQNVICSSHGPLYKVKMDELQLVMYIHIGISRNIVLS